ncbi:ABC transporter permease [Actinotalea sp. K2]|uniref:ABC transporter permease n=1 Tax=Actinotalea sp. K2 TaxID=2939438 RepID=UPI002016EEEE|nr:ABC transporter permease [Actinotalea sp. K2]MCL3859583.1 ABC transporter permease [Actinotalea sp. K2]
MTTTTAPPVGPTPTDPRQAVDPLPGAGSTWSVSWHGVRTVATLELRQRVRSTRWIVSLVVFGLLVGGVSVLTWAFARQVDDAAWTVGPTMFGFIAFFVLFLGLLVSPTLSATAINGDRAAGTLATLQVTLLSALEIVLGKLLAAWLASLAFLAVSLPFILWAFATGNTSPLAVLTTVLLLAVMLAVVCAMGLGFSALTARTAGSAVLSYVAVASLSVLSLIIFGLSVPLVSGIETVQVYEEDWEAWEREGNEYPLDGEPMIPCTWVEREQYVSHTERTWWLLAINPFVIVADAAPDAVRPRDDYYGSFDPLALIRQGVRTARLGPPETFNYCWRELEMTGQGFGAGTSDDGRPLSPVWPWGLSVNLLLGAAGVLFATHRLRIPQRTLPRGTRVA